MVDDIVSRTVELRRQGFLGDSHPDRVSDTLAQRTGGGFHARGVADFRVARRFGVQLAEVFQLGYRQIVASEVQQAVDQHRTMAIGQDKTVTVSPGRIGRVMVEEITPQHFGNVSHTHRGTRVAGFGFLYSVHAQGANSVG
ncbi:Uncharacterised protein [Klebsiella pneumoniae]|nr:Uncharacterised protein [Klebsiella pneumoniae]